MYLYLPELYPRRYNFWVSDVSVDVEVGILDDDPAAAGIFFYTFGRRFAHWSWSDLLTKTIVQKPPQHRLNSHFRVEIDFQGKIDDIPITANKDQVATNRPLFRTFARTVEKLVHPYLGIVSWLSKDNNMSYIQRFAGLERAHPDLPPQALDPLSSIKLGKVSDTVTIGKSRIADPNILMQSIAAERRSAGQGGLENLRRDGASGEDDRHDPRDVPSDSLIPSNLVHTPDSPSRHAGRDKDPLTKAEGPKPVVLTVSLMTNDVKEVAEFRKALENAARALNVRYVIK